MVLPSIMLIRKIFFPEITVEATSENHLQCPGFKIANFEQTRFILRMPSFLTSVKKSWNPAFLTLIRTIVTPECN